MSDRLKELQRQRALVQEHLNWLDREIAAASGSVQPGEKISSVIAKQILTQASLNSPPVPSGKVRGDPAAEEIIAQYQNNPKSLHGSVKRGCFLYFFIALGLLAFGVALLYFLRTKP